MNKSDLELSFNRAFYFSFSRKKFLFVFPTLLVCGMLIVLCRVLGQGAGEWVRLSLVFLPVFLISGVLLGLGIVLVRIYHNEVKRLPVSFRQIFKHSWDLMLGMSYLAIPFILIYLVLWIVLGIFYLFQGMPGLGAALFFGPFLLVFGSMVLCIANLVVLFFVSPMAALKSKVAHAAGEEVWNRIKANPFNSILSFAIGFLPLLIVGGLLSLAAKVTEVAYLTPDRALFVAFEWFFIMIPFALILSPFIIFFFNFAAESHVWSKRQ